MSDPLWTTEGGAEVPLRMMKSSQLLEALADLVGQVRFGPFSPSFKGKNGGRTDRFRALAVAFNRAQERRRRLWMRRFREELLRRAKARRGNG